MAGGVEPQSLARGSWQLLWPSLPTPRALINSVPREAKRRGAAQASPVRMVAGDYSPSHLAPELHEGAAGEPVGVHVGVSGTWSLTCSLGWGGHRASHGQEWCLEQALSWQGPRLCVCMCACVFAVQCDSGVGKLVLGGSSFLFELGWQLLAGTGTVRVTPLPTSLQLKSPLGLYCCYSY